MVASYHTSLNYSAITSTPSIKSIWLEVGMNRLRFIQRFGILISFVFLSAPDKSHWDDAGENWKRSTAATVSGIIQT
jgi:hypothetical protein